MRILLLGEYSNVHHTLAEGLRALGHEVVLASDGDYWKNYPRDIDLKRPSRHKLSSLWYMARLIRKFRHFRGYDVVQLINPMFLPLRAERVALFYKYLRKHNRKIVMGAYGMDYYYVKAGLDLKTFRYSDFNLGNVERQSADIETLKGDWLTGAAAQLNINIAADCDAVVAGLYEYYIAYKKYYPQAAGKLSYISFPIKINPNFQVKKRALEAPLQVFIGIQRNRSQYKGTDIMLRAAQRVQAEFSEKEINLRIAENVPFASYVKLISSAEVILDQLYAYTPAMNALQAMSQGIICIGGGEPEHYALLGEDELRPVVNVEPNEESVYQALRNLVVNRDTLVPKLQQQAIQYIKRHHDHILIARQYEKLYQKLLNA